MIKTNPFNVINVIMHSHSNEKKATTLFLGTIEMVMGSRIAALESCEMAIEKLKRKRVNYRERCQVKGSIAQQLSRPFLSIGSVYRDL